MSFEIIDFHMHPFLTDDEYLCMYKQDMPMTYETLLQEMDEAGIDTFCGSVIITKTSDVESMKKSNRDALKLREIYNGRYIPGFHINPLHVEESVKEIEFAVSNGFKFVGELVPYSHGWSDYSMDEFSQLLDVVEKYNLPVNLHTMDLDQMEVMAKRHKNIQFVFAHPGERARVERHIEVMKKCENVSLDISGTGIGRYGVLKHLTDKVGADRLIFGTDYPIGGLKLYITGVLQEKITDDQKEMIFSKNAKRILGI